MSCCFEREERLLAISTALGATAPPSHPHALSHRSDSFPSFPPRATFSQGEWPMHEPTRSFPVLAQLPLLSRTFRPITSPRTRAYQLHPQSKRTTILIATSVRIRICMRLIINNLQFLNRESQIIPISIA